MSGRDARDRPTSGDRNAPKRSRQPKGEAPATPADSGTTTPLRSAPIPQPSHAANPKSQRAATPNTASDALLLLSRSTGSPISDPPTVPRTKDPYRHRILLEILREKTKIKTGDEYVSLTNLRPATPTPAHLPAETQIENEIIRRGSFLCSEARHRIERLEDEFHRSYHPTLSYIHAQQGQSYSAEINDVLTREPDPKTRLDTFTTRQEQLRAGRLSSEQQKNLFAEYVQVVFEEKRLVAGSGRSGRAGAALDLSGLAPLNPSRQNVASPARQGPRSSASTEQGDSPRSNSNVGSPPRARADQSVGSVSPPKTPARSRLGKGKAEGSPSGSGSGAGAGTGAGAGAGSGIGSRPPGRGATLAPASGRSSASNSPESRRVWLDASRGISLECAASGAGVSLGPGGSPEIGAARQPAVPTTRAAAETGGRVGASPGRSGEGGGGGGSGSAAGPLKASPGRDINKPRPGHS
jgi:hypothetical protein